MASKRWKKKMLKLVQPAVRQMNALTKPYIGFTHNWYTYLISAWCVGAWEILAVVNDAMNPDLKKKKKGHVSPPAWPEAHILLTELHC